MLNFLICLLAYPNVRTESQSEIESNRKKKMLQRCEAMTSDLMETRPVFTAT